jgi:uncharacterized repeat protein (TIGR01451 family)
MHLFDRAAVLGKSLLIFSLISFGLLYADGPFSALFEIEGNYDVAFSGVTLHDGSGNLAEGTIFLDVPGTPRQVYLYWAGFDKNPGGDNTVLFSVDGAPPVSILADVQYGPDAWWVTLGTYHYVYRKDITFLALQGMHSYQISDVHMRYHYGAGIMAVYEDDGLPVNHVTIKDGLDAAYWNYEPPRGPNTEVNFVNVTPSLQERELKYVLFVGGIIDNSRLNSIWTLPGDGAVPSNIVDDALATEIGPMPPPLGVPQPDHSEWDSYGNSLTIPAMSSFAAFQIESVHHNRSENGASFLWLALATVVAEPSNQFASVGDFVWHDQNKNGLQDLAENGIPDVIVNLYHSADGTLVGSKLTDANGYYVFTDVPADSFYLEFLPPAGYFFTAPDQGDNDAIDSDPDPSTGLTKVFAVNGGDILTQWDAGLLPAVVSDLEILNHVDREFVRIGEEVVFTLTVTNLGPDSAFNVQVTNDLPIGLSFIDASPVQQSGPNPLKWVYNLPPLAPDNSVHIQIRAKTTSHLGGMDDLAFVSSGNYDPDLTNNMSSAQIHNFVPVELSSFRAVPDNGRIRLEWVTQSESENLGFNIYRSDQEEGPYVRLNDKLISGAGNSQVMQAYSFVDENVEYGKTYHYQLEDVDYNGSTNMHGPVFTATSAPMQYSLGQNFPNPFNAGTKIKFRLEKPGFCDLVIYNIKGQLVRKLVSEFKGAGVYTVQWDGLTQEGTPVPSGLYFYEITTNGFSESRKMCFVK